MEGQETNNNDLNNNNQNNNETTNQINNETEKKENSVQATNKPKIVPAYMKMKEENPDNASTSNSKKVKGKPNKVKTNKPHKKINKKLIITLVITVVLLVALSIFIYVIAQNKKYAKYLPYEETMHTYAFDIMYDNQTAETREKVTKSEAIKMAIAATLNVTSLDSIGIEPKEEYFNNVWIEYAYTVGIINDGEITEKNKDEKVTYIEFVSYLERAKNKLLEQSFKTGVELQYKDKDKYTTEEQTYLQDLIESGVIENSKSKLKGDRKVFKGEVNELVTKYAEKNNTITLEGDKININPDKIPSNVSEYPYTLSNVDKKVYETEFKKEEGMESRFESPKEMYINNKEYLVAIKDRVERFYNAILNVDYNTINADDFYDTLNSEIAYEISSDTINEYVTYLKDNQIKISGEAKVQMPIVYFDGFQYRARTKITLNVESGITKDNLLIGDLEQDDVVSYEDSNSYLVDVVLTPLLSSDDIYMDYMSLKEISVN